jgi:Domain of unknown function (DUF4142)
MCKRSSTELLICMLVLAGSITAFAAADKQEINAFQREADKGEDPEVKQFASRQLPVLKKHLEAAQATERQVKESSKPLPSGTLPHPNVRTAAYESDYEYQNSFF